MFPSVVIKPSYPSDKGSDDSTDLNGSVVAAIAVSCTVFGAIVAAVSTRSFFALLISLFVLLFLIYLQICIYLFSRQARYGNSGDKSQVLLSSSSRNS
jgi:hypothetical protein